MIKSFSSLEIRIATQKHYQTINGHQAIQNTLIKFHTFELISIIYYFNIFDNHVSCITAVRCILPSTNYKVLQKFFDEM